jgi:putative tricarboxylic transport membrane protein
MDANRSDAVIGALLFVLGAAVLITAQTFPQRTRLYVDLVSMAMILCAAILLAKTLFLIRRLKSESGQTLDPEKPVVWWFILANTVFVGAIYLVGFHLAGFLFLVGATLLLGQRNILTSVLVSGFLIGFLYVIFVLFLKVPLPRGSLFG